MTLGAIQRWVGRRVRRWFFSGLDDVDGIRLRTEEEIAEEERKWRDETR